MPTVLAISMEYEHAAVPCVTAFVLGYMQYVVHHRLWVVLCWQPLWSTIIQFWSLYTRHRSGIYH